ncbi:MAG TPA: dTDP-4-dehydrorhamnose reductase [Humisphaera sp.]
MPLYDSILIAGGNGMLAHAIRETLAARGHTFAAIDVDSHDLTKEADVARAFDEFRPTLVLNCAAFTNVDKCEEVPDVADAVNGTLVGHLAKACRRTNAALVHYSTDYVFNGSNTRPWRTDDPVGPLSAYGRSKLLGERLLQEHAPARWVIARTQWLYGPNGKNFVETILGAAKAGKPLKVVDDQVGSPTYTFHLAEATLAVLDKGGNGLWQLSNGGRTSWFGFTQQIMKQFGVTPASLGPSTSAEWKATRLQAAHRPAWSVFDLSPYEKLTGKPMPTWEDGLAAYAAKTGTARG